MEEVELIFRRAGVLVTDISVVAKELLDISKEIYTGSATLQDLTSALHDGNTEAYQRKFAIEKMNLLNDLRQEIRYRLLYITDDNFMHNFLFLLLKLYTEFTRSLHPIKILNKRNAVIFDTHVSSAFKARIDEIEIVPRSLPLSDLGELVTLTGFYLIMAEEMPKLIIRTIRREFSLKTDEIKALFDQDKYGPIPVAQHRLKHLLTKEAPTVNTGTRKHSKIPWAGNLKQFAELITELEKKGWIKPIPHGELQTTVATLLHCFDLSATQRKEDSNTENSLLQYLKPSERDLKIYTKRYVRQFTEILYNLTLQEK